MFERGWRAIATTISYVVWGGCSFLFCYLVYPATVWRIPREQRQIHARALTRKGFRWFIDFMQWMGVWRYRVEGGRRLQKPGRVIIANHPSFLDVVLLLGLVENAVCIVKPGLIRVPLVGPSMRRCGHVIADPPETVLENAIRVLNQGASLILFPQGTRTHPESPIRFHRSAARIALDAKAPILPVYFRYRPLLLGKGERWYNIPPVRPWVDVIVGEEIHPTQNGEEPTSVTARKLTRHLESCFEAWKRGNGNLGR